MSNAFKYIENFCLNIFIWIYHMIYKIYFHIYKIGLFFQRIVIMVFLYERKWNYWELITTGIVEMMSGKDWNSLCHTVKSWYEYVFMHKCVYMCVQHQEECHVQSKWHCITHAVFPLRSWNMASPNPEIKGSPLNFIPSFKSCLLWW